MRPFVPIETSRLTIRSVAAGDADALWARRNDPAVAAMQSWTLPYERAAAERVIAELAPLAGPAPDEWWMATVCDTASGTILGDLALHLTWDGRCAEIGYTFATSAWGHGYAGEAVSALVAWLFEDPELTRVQATTHPENLASVRVLERTGFVFEGHTRSSYWVGDECSDDWLFGLTRADHEAWCERPQGPPGEVGLVPVDLTNYRVVGRLRTHRSQERFVAPVLNSYADALFPEVIDGAPVVPWMRAITADGTPVGFVMTAETTPHHPDPYLWRLLVDRRSQGRGIGRRALDLLVDRVRGDGATRLVVSWVEGRGSPRGFYERYGFVPTGNIVEGETEAALDLTGSPPPAP